MDISDFDFELPEEQIAQAPAQERDASRLLHLDRDSGALRHASFRDLPDFLRPGDLLVVNRSRVFPARLLGHRANRGDAEVLLLRPTPRGTWEALLKPGRRLRVDDVIQCAENLRVVVTSGPVGEDGRREVRLERPEGDLDAVLARVGQTPLPPYIQRPPDAEDRDRYQTVYAREPGSVAAPTAGLHFTEPLLDRLRAADVEVTEVVLHVGPGTFRPVKVMDVADHRVAPEPFEVPAATVEAVARTRARGGRVIAVGTTTVRTLETAAASGTLQAGAGETDLVVVPGHRFRMVDALITNFHLPRSSLLLLVSAFAGRERVLAAYREAVTEGYRFYSYGDAMLITGGAPPGDRP